jgi:uncharacterized protein with PIN domain
MKFLADGMLGKLTRWLRILGQDVKYSINFNDEELIALAKKERRVLLTSDFELCQRSVAKKLNAFYVEAKDETERLAELSRRFAFPLQFDVETSRCPKCNAKLRSIPKEKVAGEVEKNTFENYDEFWRCPYCGKIYWHGAHWGRIRAMLGEAEGKLKLS